MTEEQELRDYWDKDNWDDYMAELKYYRTLCGDSYRLTHKPKKSKLVFNINKRKIVLSRELKLQLKDLKRGKESYDDVIKRILLPMVSPNTFGKTFFIPDDSDE